MSPFWRFLALFGTIFILLVSPPTRNSPGRTPVIEKLNLGPCGPAPSSFFLSPFFLYSRHLYDTAGFYDLPMQMSDFPEMIGSMRIHVVNKKYSQNYLYTSPSQNRTPQSPGWPHCIQTNMTKAIPNTTDPEWYDGFSFPQALCSLFFALFPSFFLLLIAVEVHGTCFVLTLATFFSHAYGSSNTENSNPFAQYPDTRIHKPRKVRKQFHETLQLAKYPQKQKLFNPSWLYYMLNYPP